MTPKENLIKLLNHETPDWIPNGLTDMWRCIPEEIHERGPVGDTGDELGGTGFDWFGVHWTYMMQSHAATPSPEYGPIMTDITKWKEQVKFPDIDSIDWKAAWERDKKRYNPDNVLCICFLNGPFERLHALMGFEEALIATALEPEACKEFFNAIIDFKIRLLDKLLEYYPIDMLEQHDDYGHQQNAFFPVSQWEDLFAAPLKKLIDHCKEKGVIFQLHSCGKVETLIPSMVNAGLEHWSSCQRINNLESILHNFGDKLTISIGGSSFLKLDDSEPLDEAKQREILENQVFSLCKGGAGIPAIRDPRFNKTFVKMLEEKKDFFKDPANCKLPE